MSLKWITPADPPTGQRVIRLYVPAGDDWESIVRGALTPLFAPHNFEDLGGETVEDTAQTMLDVVGQTLRWEECATLLGVVVPFASAVLPDGWLLCDGTEHEQTTYPELYSLIGSNFGSASEGYFRVPNLTARSAVGAGSTGLPGGFNAVGLGEAIGQQERTLSTNHLPPHTHDLSNHAHTVPLQPGVAATPGPLPVATVSPIPYNTSGPIPNLSGSTGSKDPFSVQSPGLGLYYVIRAIP